MIPANIERQRRENRHKQGRGKSYLKCWKLLVWQVDPKQNLFNTGIFCPANMNWVSNHQLCKLESSGPEPFALWNRNLLISDCRLICYEKAFDMMAHRHKLCLRRLPTLRPWAAESVWWRQHMGDWCITSIRQELFCVEIQISEEGFAFKYINFPVDTQRTRSTSVRANWSL